MLYGSEELGRAALHNCLYYRGEVRPPYAEHHDECAWLVAEAIEGARCTLAHWAAMYRGMRPTKAA